MRRSDGEVGAAGAPPTVRTDGDPGDRGEPLFAPSDASSEPRRPLREEGGEMMLRDCSATPSDAEGEERLLRACEYDAMGEDGEGDLGGE